MSRKFILLAFFLISTPKAYAIGCNSSTVFLTHLDGSNNGVSFSDEDCDGTGRHTITANGNVKTDNTNSMFAQSATFDGTGDFLTMADGSSSADYDMGTGSFTFNFRVFSATGGLNYCILDMDNGVGGSGMTVQTSFVNNRVEVYMNATEYDFAFTFSTSTWYAIEVQRNVNQLTVRVNGTLVGVTQTSAEDIQCAGTVRIGSRFGGATELNGKLDEIRLMKGAIAHTANYTPEGSAYNPSSEVMTSEML